MTTIDLLADVVPQEPPLVVKVNIIGLVELELDVKVAVSGVLPVLLLNVPLGALHTADVAPPSKLPPNAPDVAP